MNLQPGDVVMTTTVTRQHWDEAGKLVASFTFKAPKGEAFTFVFVGTAPKTATADQMVRFVDRRLKWHDGTPNAAAETKG